ncbi:MAG: type II toxin-antitoxin system RelE/ParE family toxin [Thermoanaerobaculia bacterium]
MKSYRFLEEADAEFQETIRFYDEQVAGLGDRFIQDVERTIAHIRDYPESGVLVSRRLRKRILHTFKYSILYFNAPTEIIVVAIAAHKRKPGFWRNRLHRIPN